MGKSQKTSHNMQRGAASMHKSSAYEKRRKRLRYIEIVIAFIIIAAMVFMFAASMY